MATETAFTFLHRLAALRVAEERDVVRPCVRGGQRAEGFQLFRLIADGALGSDGEAYRVFLDRTFDEVALDLPPLFDRRAPHALVFPGERCLDEVLQRLNDPELEDVWRDDETVGWVFQDFHTVAERRDMRRGRTAPRDSHELAVRNQVFTPRWVVRFLTDNSLGALWIAMSDGESRLTEECQYLHRAGELAEVAHKDPRDLRVLDPACGSGHFLLYAFDLLESIYAEAWERRRGTSLGRTPLWDEYPDRHEFLRAVPGLILRHNLYGVDIDLRAVQVAGLTLWLRAHRSYQQLGLSSADRPRIERANLVCAEPMPGDEELLEGFAESLRPRVLGDLVRRVWDEMRPAGEMGLLLRTDRMIQDLVREAREGWEAVTGGPGQAELADLLPNWPGRRYDFSDLAQNGAARFWADAERRVLDALADYAARAERGERVRRRLFAEEAEQGFGLVDLSRARFDVVLMNPPFGDPAEGSQAALGEAYPDCGGEIYAMFFQRALELLEPQGRVGAITNRTWLAVKTLRGLRESVFGQAGAVVLGADLGYGVLDAKVETAAVVVDRSASLDTTGTWVRLLRTRCKAEQLAGALEASSAGMPHGAVFACSARRSLRLPEAAYAYWMSDELVDRYSTSPDLGTAAGAAVVGTQATPDFRFLRLAWEVDPAAVGLGRKWPRFAKGGEYRPFWDDVHLLLNWETNGAELGASPRAYVRNARYYGSCGTTWPNRTTSPFGPRALPEGCAFGHMGPSAFPREGLDTSSLLGVLASRPVRLMLAIRLGAGDEQRGAMAKHYEVGMVRDLPWPEPTPDQAARIDELAARAVAISRLGQLEEDPTGESCVAFAAPPVLLAGRALPLREAVLTRVAAREDRLAELADLTAEIDDLVADAYAFSERDRAVMDEEIEPSVARLPTAGHEPDADVFRTAYLTSRALPGDRLPGGLDAEVDARVEHRRGRQQRLRDETTLCRLFELPPRRLAGIRRRLDLLRDEDLARCAADIVHYAVGVAFGRWDVRLVLHPEWIPGWPAPFGALPGCPLGQLVDGHALPATREHIASDSWLASRTDASALPAVEPDDDGVLWLVRGDGQRTRPAEVGQDAYPVPVPWDGVLQDDVLEDGRHRHADDLAHRVGLVLDNLFGDGRPDHDDEIVQALGVRSLGDYLRQPGQLFANHLARYWKSRRRAPLFWPLSTDSGGYTLWVYYPRLTPDTLPGLVNRLHRSLEALRREEASLEAAMRAEDSDRGAAQRRLDLVRPELAEREALRERLRALDAKGYRPDLDDGVAINAAPLAACFRHRPWRTYLEGIWQGLEDGEHDWARLAMQLWPDRVQEKCRTDRSLAIAHRREDLFEPPPEAPRRRRRRRARRGTQTSMQFGAEGEAQDG